ncbi:MAG TPA: RidA family protein [Methylomirabilota bacterium]|jgi:enamine deaminase RidA (YjgF/YER057c/UK114 family)|nr:RidA family protein [Methylomirabilota bacterium]
MPRTLISSGMKFERIASYSRAVVDGDMIYVSGTTGFSRRSGRYPEGVIAQTEQALRTISWALGQAGATLADVLRVRVFIAERQDLLPVCRVVGRHFRRIRPANTTVCTPLATPEMKVEIEVTARRGSGTGARPRRRRRPRG